MPWKPTDALRHTKAAATPARQALWSTIANRALTKHGDDARAIREANAVIGHLRAGKK